MPAKANRSSTLDRPPRACDGAGGSHGSTYFQTSSGMSSNLASMPSRDHGRLRPATFQHVPGGALSDDLKRTRFISSFDRVYYLDQDRRECVPLLLATEGMP